MKGLLLKDFYLIRRYIKTYLLILVVYGALSIAQKNFAFISGVNVALFAIMPINTLSYDGACNWNSYALSAPSSRKAFALEKYVFALLLSLIGIAITLTVGTIIVLGSAGEVSWGEIFGAMIGQIAATILSTSLTLPAAFKYGPEKARYITILVFMIPFLGVMALSQMELALPALPWMTIGICGVLALLFVAAVSIRFSVQICKKLEV